MCGLFGKMGEGRVATWLLQHDFQEMVAKGFFLKLTKLVGADFLGSPIGYSFPVNGLGAIDSAGTGDNEPGHVDSAFSAVREYIDSPAVETHDVPPPDADAGVDSGGDSSAEGALPSSDGGGGEGEQSSEASRSFSNSVGGGTGSSDEAGADDSAAVDGSGGVEEVPPDEAGVCLPDGSEKPGSGSPQ
jgi:hypothetical protein